jgi:hypothetical protein
VLDSTHVLAGHVAPDLHLVARDAGGLGGEARLRGRTRVCVDGVPPRAALHDPSRQGERGDHSEPNEQTAAAAADRW